MTRFPTALLAATLLTPIASPAAADPAPAAPAAPAPAPAPAGQPAPLADLIRAIDIPYEQFTLANGLRVIVHTDRKAPVVAVSIWYDVGSKHEPKGKTGFAHLFEHLMFNGSENAPGDFFEPLKQVGATDVNGTTYYDRTNYYETVPTAALPRALFLESDRMGHLTGAITQAVLDEQRGVVQNEKRERDNEPYGLLAYRQVEGLFPRDHPYGHLTIGSMADLDAASLADVKAWFRSHYGPNNAVLVLAGDIDAATARPMVERYFGAIPRGPETHRPAAPIPTLPARLDETMTDRVAATLITRAWIVPGLNDADAVALDVAASVLGGLASSRLDTAMVKRERLATQVSAYNESFAQVGEFGVTMMVRPGVDAAEAGRRLDALIADFIARGPTDDEVRRAVTSDVANRIAGLESVGGDDGKAVTLAEGALYSGDPAFYRRQLTALAAQTPATVIAAMKKWLTRPVYALNVVPGERPAYAEAAPPPPAPPAAEPPPVVAGTRGAMPPVGAPAALAWPQVSRVRLANGIELVHARRNAVPITQASISFDAGIAADVADRLGTEQLALALLDEGVPGRDTVQIAEAKERLGASIGTGLTADRTTVSLRVPSANLMPGVGLLADIVRRPTFLEAEVTRVRAQALAGIEQELTTPDALAARLMPRRLYGPASPYAKSFGSGDPKAIAALTRADIVAFHQAWLRPEKARIYVVSDRPLAEVQAVFERAFGDWRGTGAPGEKVFPDTPLAPVPGILLVDRPGSPQSFIAGGAPTPLGATDDFAAAIVANDALGGDFTARINMDLREAKHWSYGAYGTFQRNERAVSYRVNAPVQADRTGDSLVALRAQLRDFVTTRPITADELARGAEGSARELSGQFETGAAVLQAMQLNDLYRRPDDYYATLAQRYRALTRDEVDATARRAIDPNGFTWVIVGDAKAVRPQLDSLGLPVEVIPAASVADARQGEH